MTGPPRVPIPFVWLVGLLVLAGCAQEPGPAPAEAADEAQAVEGTIRPEASGLHGAVVSGHPLASAAGYEVLRAGGTATDAVVTMAAILTVVRPHMNSVGGDAFALFYEASSGQVAALNGSGRAAQGATPAFFHEREIESMPGSGALSVTVPGAVAAWADALERYGTLSLSQALAPAVEIARNGFVVSETLADDLSGARRLNQAGQDVYLPGGERLEPGDVLRSPALADALERIAREGPSAVYGGAVGASIVTFLEEEGSPLRLADFEAHTSTWTEPAAVEFRGRRVLSMPANSQGPALLQIMGMAETLPLEEMDAASPELLHQLVEMKKLAFADRDRWIADPEHADVPLDRLLDPDYLRERAALVGERAADAREPGFGAPVVDEAADAESGGSEAGDSGAGDSGAADSGAGGDDGDTVYLMAVDAQGNAVSWIQSIFSSFGSGLVDPGTGIVLQNRGAGFTLQEGHPNQVAPGKRPFHTLLPAMVLGPDGAVELTVGTPGGHGQPQTVAQVLIQTLVLGMSPQEAVEFPRFRSESGTRLLVESRMPAAVRDALAERGHEVDAVAGWTAAFGNAQVIRRLPNGALRTGADMRREAFSLAW